MNSLYLEKLINDFFMRVEVKDIEINSEANLERKLACYIEDNISNNFKVETQKNIVDFGIKKISNIGKKSEIDIAIFNEDKSIKFAIELKYPHNIVKVTGSKGGYKKSMSEFIKDIYFTEELKKEGFTETYVLIIVDDSTYYNNNKIDENKLYKYFRDGNKYPINGPINIECGKGKNKKITVYDIKGKYHIDWKDFNNKKYYLGRIKI